MAAMRPLLLLLAMLALTACAIMPRATVALQADANEFGGLSTTAEERWADKLDAITVDSVAIERIGEDEEENRAMMELEAELDSAVEAEVSNSAQWQSEVRRFVLPAVDGCGLTLRAHADLAAHHRSLTVCVVVLVALMWAVAVIARAVSLPALDRVIDFARFRPSSTHRQRRQRLLPLRRRRRRPRRRRVRPRKRA